MLGTQIQQLGNKCPTQVKSDTQPFENIYYLANQHARIIIAKSEHIPSENADASTSPRSAVGVLSELSE